MAQGEGRFRLRGWRGAGAGDPAMEELSDDLPALRARAAVLLGEGYRRADIEAWNLELNDWVRLERFA